MQATLTLSVSQHVRHPDPICVAACKMFRSDVGFNAGQKGDSQSPAGVCGLRQLPCPGALYSRQGPDGAHCHDHHAAVQC